MLRRIFHALSIILISSAHASISHEHDAKNQLKRRNLSKSNMEWVPVGDRLLAKAEDGILEDENGGSGLGSSIASSSDGKIVATGSPYKNDNMGIVAVHYYDHKKHSWVQMGDDIHNPNGSLGTGNFFGEKVALSHSGTVLVVSAPRANSSKGFVSVYRFDKATNSWEKIGENIEGEIDREQFGFSIAISEKGNIVAIGAPNPTYQPGSVRVYEYDGTNKSHEWIKMGNSIMGEANDDEAGHSVDILQHENNVYVAVGAPMDSTSKGSASVYQLNQGTFKWDQLGLRYVDGNKPGTQLGRAVSLGHDGTKLILAVGFPGPGVDETSSIKSGVEVYSITDDGLWDYYSQLIFPIEQYDNTGYEVSLSRDGQTLAVASPDYQDSGALRVFKRNKNSKIDESPFEQIGDIIMGEKYDELGYSIALSRDGNIFSVGSVESSYVATFVLGKSSSKGRSAFGIVLLTFSIAGLVVFLSFVIVKSTHRLRNGEVQFSSIVHQQDNCDDANTSHNVENNSNKNEHSSFPVHSQAKTGHFDDHDSDGESESGMSYEEEKNIDYETHLAKII